MRMSSTKSISPILGLLPPPGLEMSGGCADCFCTNCLQTFFASFSDPSGSQQKLDFRRNVKFSLILWPAQFQIGILHLFSVTSPRGGSRGAADIEKAKSALSREE